MTTIFIDVNNKPKSNLGFTKATAIPKNLSILSNPLNCRDIKVEDSCTDGNINLVITNDNTSINTSNNKKESKIMRKLREKMISLDVSYIVPLNVDENIEQLKKLVNKEKKEKGNTYPIENYHKINDDKNIFIYQLVNDELYILSLTIRNFFDSGMHDKNLLFNNISNSLNHTRGIFKNQIKEELFDANNSRHTFTIHGGCWTMQGHNNYTIPTKYEKYCHIAGFLQNYMKDYDEDYSNIKSKEVFDYFKKNKAIDEMIDIKITYFNDLLKSRNKFEFYLYLKNTLFPLVIELELLISELVKCRFPKLYLNFKIDLPSIKTELSFFKTFAINFGLEDENREQLQRQGATDPHTDKNDCLYAFCVIVVFGKFEGEELVLSEIGIVIEIKCGYIVFLRSTLLEHFNLHVLGNRFSIVFYLRKTIFNEQ